MILQQYGVMYLLSHYRGNLMRTLYLGALAPCHGRPVKWSDPNARITYGAIEAPKPVYGTSIHVPSPVGA